MASKLVIRRPSGQEPRSLIIPLAMAKYTAVEHLPSDPTQAKLAEGNFYGFVTKKVTVAGPEAQLKSEAFLPGGLIDVDATVGDAVTLVDALEFEAEGADYVMSTGVMTINNGTPIGTELSFQNGQVCVKVASQTSFFQLMAILTPEDNTNVTRILAVRI